MNKIAVPDFLIEEIKNANYLGDIVSVPREGYNFNDRILKCGKLTFEAGGELLLNDLRADSLVIVAQEIRFNDTDELAMIRVASEQILPQNGPNHLDMSQALYGLDGSSCNNGTDGHHGLNGADGIQGSDGIKLPDLYIIAGKIINQPSGVLPDALRVRVFSNGVDGGLGGDGQNGQNGGNGGSGGSAKWAGLWCDCGAGYGGNGGNGGLGGAGGKGGNGGNGGNVIYGGDSVTLDIFTYFTVLNRPGLPVRGGVNGTNGFGGGGGPRGSHPGDCGGGGSGNNGETTPYTTVLSESGQLGRYGVISQSDIDVNTLF